MKTSLIARNFLVVHKLKPLWEKLSDFLKTGGYALVSYLLAVPSLTVCCLRDVLTSMMTLRVRAGLAGASRAWTAMANCTINNRIYAGLILVSIVAPLSSCIHMLFDKDSQIEGWYYFSYFYLYLVLGPYFFCLCIIAAAFLWIPPKTKRIKVSQRSIKFQLTRILSIPFGLIVGKIIWLLQVTSNGEFHQLPSLLSLAAGIAIGYVAIRILDYLVWRQEHAMNALIDSLEGLYNLPNIDHVQRTELAKPYWKELREFHSKY